MGVRAPNYLFPVGHLIANFRRSPGRGGQFARVPPNQLGSRSFMTTQTDSAVVFKKPQSFANWEGYTTTIVLEKSAIEKAK